MNAFSQLVCIAGISLTAAAATYLVKGPPSRTVACDPSLLQEDEVCLATVTGDWQGQVLWVDARPRSDWQANGRPGSILWNIDPAEDSQAMEAEAMAHLVEAPRVVVYCGDENCGISRQVAAKIRELGLGNEVFVLYGGWRALQSAGLVRDSNSTP